MVPGRTAISRKGQLQVGKICKIGPIPVPFQHIVILEPDVGDLRGIGGRCLRAAVDVDDVGVYGIAGGIDVPRRHLEAEVIAGMHKIQLLMELPAGPEVEPVVAPGHRILPRSSVGAELPLSHGIIGGMRNTVAEGRLAVQLIVPIGRSECDGFRGQVVSGRVGVECDALHLRQRIWNFFHDRRQLIVRRDIAVRH